MAPTLYMIAASPPVRSVLLCAKALGMDFNYREVDLLNNQHLRPDFLKINPQHTVPVLNDSGFILVDSHAIMCYLVDKYGDDTSLYPKDLNKRAIVNHRLHFDSGILFARGLIISRSLLFEGAEEIPQKLLDSLADAFSIVEQFLQKTKWVAGDQLTIADFSFATSLLSWSIFVPLSQEKYPKIKEWLKRMEALPYFKDANTTGQEQYFELIRAKLTK